MDMIQDHHAAAQRREYTAIDLAVYTAQILAFTTLSRVSEYLYTGESGAHTLMTEYVQFEMQDGTIVPSNEVGMKEFKNVSGCIVNIRSAKMTRPVAATAIFSQCATRLKTNQHTVSRGSYGGTCNTHARDHVCRSSTYRNSSGRSNLRISLKDCRRWR